MSIVVFWMEPTAEAAHARFESTELTAALKFAEARRQEGKRHVCISTELAESVGKAGVTAVVDKRLPDGHVYDFDKSHRGAGPSKS